MLYYIEDRKFRGGGYTCLRTDFSTRTLHVLLRDHVLFFLLSKPLVSKETAVSRKVCESFLHLRVNTCMLFL